MIKVSLPPELNIVNLKISLQKYDNAEDVILDAYGVETQTEGELVERTIHSYTADSGKQYAVMTDENPEKTPFEFYFIPAEKAILYGLYTEEGTNKLHLYIRGSEAITCGSELLEPSFDKNTVEMSEVITSLPEGSELDGTPLNNEIIEKLAGYYSPTAGDILFVTESNRFSEEDKVNYHEIQLVGVVRDVEAYSRADLSVLEKPYVG